MSTKVVVSSFVVGPGLTEVVMLSLVVVGIGTVVCSLVDSR